MWRWSDSLNFLRAEDFGRTRPLSVSAFPRVDSSMAFERRDDRADCVRDTVNRVGRRRWKRSSVALSAAASTTSIERIAWAFIDLRGTRNYDDVCWVAALRLQSLPETAKCGRKNTNNGEWTIHRRGKEAQVAKNKIFPLTCCWGRHLEGARSCPKSLSTPSRTSNWRKMRANPSRKSTATVVDLRAVVRRWVNFLHALDIIKTTDAVLSSIPREALSALTPECVPHWRSWRTQVQVWIAFVFTGLSFSCSCVCFIHRIVLRFLSLLLRSDFITLRSKKSGNKIVARRRWRNATAFRSHHQTRKMVLQKPVGTTRLENAEVFRKVRKTTFSRSPPGQ